MKAEKETIKFRTPKENRIKMSRQEWTYQIVINVIMVLVLVICVVPLFYVLGMSLSSEGEMLERNYFIIIPRKPVLSAYKYIITGTNFLHGMLITLIRTLLGVVVALVFPLILGYTLANYDFPCRKALMIYLIITMILGGGLIPGYLLMSKLHLLNTFWVYIVPAFGNPYGVLVVKMFVEGLPQDVMDSAELDGASELQKLSYIALPLLKPTLCALGLFAAVAHWNDWFSTMLYVRDSNLYPAQYIIRNLLTQTAQTDISNNLVSTYVKMTPQSLKMASVVVAVLPILCVYPFLQKYFIYGMYTGSVKG
ncbi:carbohydrate ABC transporter permease [uncultured Acetatifactor sp.]|jgi:putative aldouronate transport system permease protein|uniref:carbohydrate ABC transporter permease n=1 Tax=uncultured Acetatifactor sp. TaxID=1671927 RepID=UPI0025FF8DD3|nr:carbohydrate ABC transporter permease [uncultured Acetatifactor sp.]MCI9573323.1 carbohydrate ABC transporter permease [Lachnospiraceae bacterium]